MRQERGKHKNFFVAKNSDCESARIESGPRRAAATTSPSPCAIARRITKSAVAQLFPARSVIGCTARQPAFHGAASARHRRSDEYALRLVDHTRQYFLKRDSVFLGVLVYSGCSAFDSRMHAAIKPSQTSEGNMAKKAKKAKKAKSAVKKTAKKTRKVAKKKK